MRLTGRNSSIWQPSLEDELVSLLPLEDAHRDALFAVASDPLIWSQHPAKVRSTRTGFDTFFEESMASGGALLIKDKKHGRVIGSSRFHKLPGVEDKIEIGWTFLGRAHWGGIYNGSVKRLMIDYAFHHVEEVLLFIDAENLRSQRAAEKIGAVQVFDRELLKSAGKSMDTLIYHIQKSSNANMRDMEFWKG